MWIMGLFGVVMGHSRSLEMAPIDGVHMSSYTPYIATVLLFCTIYEV